MGDNGGQMSEKLEEEFLIYKQNVYPGMIEVLNKELGVTVGSDIGFYPGEQAWVLPERDDCGHIVGLVKRYRNGKKAMFKGSKRGLAYECVGQVEKGKISQQQSSFVRCYNENVDCPLCGKRKWCMVSNDDSSNPSAVICGHTPNGAIRHIENSGYLHRLRDNGRSRQNAVLPSTNKSILVVEGWSDVWAAKDMGYVAIGKPNAESGHIWLASLLKGQDVIVIGENDEAGRRGMDKTFQVLRACCTKVRKLLPPPKHKDLRAWLPTVDEFELWLDQNGSEADTSKVVDNVDYIALAERWLANQIQRFIYYLSDWYQYNGVYYQLIPDDSLRQQIRGFFKDFEVVSYQQKVKIVKPLYIDKRFVGEIEDALKSQCLVMVPKEISEPFYIGKKANLDLSRGVIFRNGLYQVEKEELLPLTDEIFTTSTLPFKYDPHARCPKWLWFVHDIFNGDIECVELLQEWFGYNLIADNSLQQMLFLYGVKGSGKSTTTEIMRTILGPNRCSAINSETFTTQFGLAPLVGKYAAIISEAEITTGKEAQRILEKLKQITGQDTISIRRLYKEAFDTKLFCRITYVGNVLPRFQDEPQALFRRFNLLYYRNSYTSPDRTLGVALAKEAPGIAMWALEGLKRLLENGDFIKPVSSESHIKDCKALASPLKTMIDQWCDFGGDLYISCNTLYDLHKAIFLEDGYKPMNRIWFGVRFKNAFPHISKGQRYSAGRREYVYEGLTIMSDAYKKFLGRP